MATDPALQRDNNDDKAATGYEVFTETPDMAALIHKHRPAINRVLDTLDMIDSSQQSEIQKEEFRKRGVDPDALMENYRDTLVKDALELREKNETASRWVRGISLTSMVATLAAFIPLDKKLFINQNPVKWLFGACSAITMGVFTNFVTTKWLTSSIRQASETGLSIAGRDAMERELAVLLEKEEIEKNTPPNNLSREFSEEVDSLHRQFARTRDQQGLMAGSGFTGKNLPKAPPLPRENHISEALKPKPSQFGMAAGS